MSARTRHGCYDLSRSASMGSWRRQVIAWLGTVVLLFNLVAGGTLPAHRVTSSLASGINIEICSVHGIEVLGQDGQPVSPAGGGDSHAELCIFCLPLMHGGVDLPVAAAIASAPVAAPSVLPAPALERRAIPARLASDASPRAPPLA